MAPAAPAQRGHVAQSNRDGGQTALGRDQDPSAAQQ